MKINLNFLRKSNSMNFLFPSSLMEIQTRQINFLLLKNSNFKIKILLKKSTLLYSKRINRLKNKKKLKKICKQSIILDI